MSKYEAVPMRAVRVLIVDRSARATSPAASRAIPPMDDLLNSMRASMAKAKGNVESASQDRSLVRDIIENTTTHKRGIDCSC